MRQTISNMMAQAENNAEVQLRQMERISMLEKRLQVLEEDMELALKTLVQQFNCKSFLAKKSLPKETNNSPIL